MSYECDECERDLRGGHATGCSRAARANAGLQAEVAEHQDDELVCPACGRPYALHGIECESLRDRSPLDSLEQALAKAEEVGIGPGSSPNPADWPAGVPDEPTDPGPRFGDRLRGFRGAGISSGVAAMIADAIDQDADELRENAESALYARVPTTNGGMVFLNERALQEDERRRREHLRTLVETLVEESRYTLRTISREKDVLDVEPFLDRLPGIFGAREEMGEEEAIEWLLAGGDHQRPRLTLHLGVVDLRGIPEGLLWGGKEYRSVLDQTTEAGWSWLNSTGSDSGLVGIGVLKAVPS